MKIHFIGCGDAFGTGGRFNTCFMVERETEAFLIDCGASTMVAMRQQDIDPNSIVTIFVSHLHGDHFGGLPFFILDGQFYSRREAPLTVVGPPGLALRLRQAMELFFPGSADAPRKFELMVREIVPGTESAVGDIRVASTEVRHACGAPALALRIACDGKIIAYSGDSEWTDTLIEVARGADLFIAEALSYEKRIPQHLNYSALLENEERLGARRMLLTHLGPDMFSRVDEAHHEVAYDGLVLEV